MNMKDASLWMHQRPRSYQTGGGPFLSEAVSSSMIKQGSHSCLEEEQSLGPALGCRAAGSGCPAGWECAAEGTSCSTGSPYAGSWLQKHCPEPAAPCPHPPTPHHNPAQAHPISRNGSGALRFFPKNSAQKPRGT